jgi:uncharacterized protein YbjT (DUF2867 family)
MSADASGHRPAAAAIGHPHATVTIPNPNHTAVILGASGSVGQALLGAILRRQEFTRVIVIVRRAMGLQEQPPGRVAEQLVPDMQPLALRKAVVDALRETDGTAVGFSVLGVGAGTAGLSLQAHRAVDVGLNEAFAAGLKDSGKVRHLAFMSAVGADIRARTTGSGAAGMPRYCRVKGEAEQAVLQQGLEAVSIFRPSLIIGSRHTPVALATTLRLLSPLLPDRLHPISTTQLARAMVAAALAHPGGHAVYAHAGMLALVAKAS